MSDQPVTLEFLGRQMLALTSDVRDMQQRVTVLEARFGAMETRLTALALSIESRFDAVEKRLAAQEERQSRMLDLMVRIASRIGVEGAV